MISQNILRNLTLDSEKQDKNIKITSTAVKDLQKLAGHFQSKYGGNWNYSDAIRQAKIEIVDIKTT